MHPLAAVCAEMWLLVSTWSAAAWESPQIAFAVWCLLRLLPVAAVLQFNSVTTLHILVESNQDDEDTTKLFKIVLGGVAFDSFNVAEIKKVEDKS